MILLFCSALVKLHLEYCVQFWDQYKKNVDLQKQVHHRTTNVIKELTYFSYEERLRELGQFIPEKIQKNLINNRCL